MRVAYALRAAADRRLHAGQASVDWHPFADRPDLTPSLAGNNLFDVDARRSTSLYKDFAPLAGRDVRLTLNLKV
jgi:iron complex outermembrane receptor protein